VAETIISLGSLEGLDGEDLDVNVEKEADYMVLRVAKRATAQVLAALKLMGSEYEDFAHITITHWETGEVLCICRTSRVASKGGWEPVKLVLSDGQYALAKIPIQLMPSPTTGSLDHLFSSMSISPSFEIGQRQLE
jgi:hypothetical protein